MVSVAVGVGYDERAVTVEGRVLRVRLALPERAQGARVRLVLAHGAGGDKDSPFMRYFSDALARRGVEVVTFDFGYRSARKGPPDRLPRLMAEYRAAIEAAGAWWGTAPLFIGGKSLGGRVASHLAAEGHPASGLILLGYPLHPAGRTDRLRVEHLPRIKCPMLFVAGTRDPLARWDLLERTLKDIGERATVHSVDGGDHSLEVPKRDGRAREAIWDEAADGIAHWVQTHGP